MSVARAGTTPGAQVAAQIGSQAGLWWIALGATLAILLIPLCTTDLPPLLDYPNHLARMYVLHAHASNAAIGSMYSVDWHVIPNIAMDVLVPPLLHVLPLEIAGSLFLALVLVVPVLGVVALHRAAFQSESYWPLASAIVAYNGLFFAGFVNFQLGVGLALFGGAAWLRCGTPVSRLVTGVVFSLVIFFCHLIAWAFFALLILGIEGARAWRNGKRSRDRLAGLVIATTPFIIPGVLYLRSAAAIAPAGAGVGHSLLKQYYWALTASPWQMKIIGLVSPFIGYSLPLDLSTLGIVLCVIRIAAWRRRLGVAPELWPAFAALCVIYPLVPFVTMKAAWVDQRLPIMAGFLLFAMTDPRRISRPVVLVIAGLMLARMGLITAVWAGHNQDLSDFRRIIASVEPKSRVLLVTANDTAPDRPEPRSRHFLLRLDATFHLAGLLVTQQNAFWPALFSAPDKQPIRVLPPYARVAVSEGIPPTWRALTKPSERELANAPYLRSWRQDFDYVICFYAGRLPDQGHIFPDMLDPIALSDIAALYRIRHDE
ncbi:MAG: hypothetical protein JOY71_21210 [Acetobacteraceae bacterium]|nr:hypothetical protein [Acetobacteraceae bacterium]